MIASHREAAGCPRGRAAHLPSLWEDRALVPLAEYLHPAAEPGLFLFRPCGPLGQHPGELPQDGRLPGRVPLSCG